MDNEKYILVEKQVLINALALLEELNRAKDGEMNGGPIAAAMALMAWADGEHFLINQTISELNAFIYEYGSLITIVSVSDNDWIGVYFDGVLSLQGEKEYVYSRMIENIFNAMGLEKENVKRVEKDLSWLENNRCPIYIYDEN